MIKIEKKVPMPAANPTVTSEVRLALEKLKVGESFELPDGYALGNYTAKANIVRKKKGFTFTRRGRRVWRVA